MAVSNGGFAANAGSLCDIRMCKTSMWKVPDPAADPGVIKRWNREHSLQKPSPEVHQGCRADSNDGRTNNELQHFGISCFTRCRLLSWSPVRSFARRLGNPQGTRLGPAPVRRRLPRLGGCRPGGRGRELRKRLTAAKIGVAAQARTQMERGTAAGGKGNRGGAMPTAGGRRAPAAWKGADEHLFGNKRWKRRCGKRRFPASGENGAIKSFALPSMASARPACSRSHELSECWPMHPARASHADSECIPPRSSSRVRSCMTRHC